MTTIYQVNTLLFLKFQKFQQKFTILKTNVKMKIMPDNIEDYNVMHTVTSRIMNSM